jgi:hypothetical protein
LDSGGIYLAALAARSELGQAFHLVPGTFYVVDLCIVTVSPFAAEYFP